MIAQLDLKHSPGIPLRPSSSSFLPQLVCAQVLERLDLVVASCKNIKSSYWFMLSSRSQHTAAAAALTWYSYCMCNDMRTSSSSVDHTVYHIPPCRNWDWIVASGSRVTYSTLLIYSIPRFQYSIEPLTYLILPY